MHGRVMLAAGCLMLLAVVWPNAGAGEADEPDTRPVENGAVVSQALPGLATGALTHAVLVDLPDDIIVLSGELMVSKTELEGNLSSTPILQRLQRIDYAFTVVEKLVERALLLREARQAQQATGEEPQLDGDALLPWFLDKIAGEPPVGDEEIREFYDQNKRILGVPDFEEVKNLIEAQLRDEKRRAVVREHVRTLGLRSEILLSEPWAKDQARVMIMSAVDKARWNGHKPTVVAFSSPACCIDPTRDAMAAIAENLKGEASVVHVNASEDVMLAERYDISSLPTLIFFDSEGNEIYRQSGQMGRIQVINKLKGIPRE